MMDYTPWARIVLRYIVGFGMAGSGKIGEVLAADPDLVFAVALAIGAAVEAFYIWAKRKGLAT